MTAQSVQKLEFAPYPDPAAPASRRGSGAGKAAGAGAAQAAEPTRSAEAARDPAHALAGELLGGADRLVDGGHHHVGEDLGVLGVDRLGIDPDLLEDEVAAHLDLHGAAARARLDRFVLELL